MAKETNNKFEVYAENSINVDTDAGYQGDAERNAGSVLGFAKSKLWNTAQRQVSKLVVGLANLIARHHSGETIGTNKTIEELDDLVEKSIQLAAANGPAAQINDVVYTTGGAFVGVIPNYTLANKNKLTLRFSTTDSNPDTPVTVDVDGNPYPVKLKDTGNVITVSETQHQGQGQIADVYFDGSEIIINRIEPQKSEEQEYDLVIQSQQTIVPVENSPFGDSKIVGKSSINLLDDDTAGCEVTTGWTAYGVLTIDSANEYEGTNCLKLTLGDTTANFWRDILSKLDTSKYYLISAYVKNGDLSGAGIRLNINCVGDAGDIVSGYSTGTFYNRLGVVIQPTNFDTATEVRLTLLMYGVAAEYAYVDAIVVQEISAAEYAKGADELITNVYSAFFKGLKSVENPELRVRNKNLLDKDNANVLEVYVSGTIQASASTRTLYLKVKPNTSYTVSRQVLTERFTMGFTTSEPVIGATVSDEVSGTGSLSMTSTSSNDSKYLVVYFYHSTHDILTPQEILNIIQVEENNVATIFIDHDHSSKKYPNQTLGDVPNGAADWIDTINNILHEVTKPHTLIDGDFVSYNTAGAAVDVVVMNKHADWIENGVNLSLATTQSIIFVGFRNGVYADNVANIGMIYSAGNITYGLIVAKGEYADLAAAKVDLIGTKLRYELAEEVITEDIDSDGIAYAYKNMTMEIIQDNGFSNSWFARHNLNYEATVAALAAALKETQKQVDVVEVEKVDKVSGYALSKNDYSDVEKAKVATLEGNVFVLYDTSYTIVTATAPSDPNLITLLDDPKDYDKILALWWVSPNAMWVQIPQDPADGSIPSGTPCEPRAIGFDAPLPYGQFKARESTLNRIELYNAVTFNTNSTSGASTLPGTSVKMIVGIKYS